MRLHTIIQETEYIRVANHTGHNSPVAKHLRKTYGFRNLCNKVHARIRMLTSVERVLSMPLVCVYIRIGQCVGIEGDVSTFESCYMYMLIMLHVYVDHVTYIC